MKNPLGRRKLIRHNTQSSTSTVIKTVPIDLIIEILSRLPPKTIAKCRCVSNQWSSLLRGPDFTETYLTRSSTRPSLIFTFEYNGKWNFFLSSLDKDKSVVKAKQHMSLSRDSDIVPWNNELCLSINGLMYLNYERTAFNGKIDRLPVIYNPSTGQSVTLPKVGARNLSLESFFGYDPIDKQYKVLCMTVARYRGQIKSKEHQVLTLGTGKMSWRKIECLFPQYLPMHAKSVCINGVLYYIARGEETDVLTCFDVRYEIFSFKEIEHDSGVNGFLSLIDYKGKLGVLVEFDGSNCELWVVDDTEKEIWSKHVLAFPEIDYDARESIWMTNTGEIAWVDNSMSRSFYVFFYNLETQNVRRVEVKGLGAKALYRTIFTFNNVENLMFL